MHGVGSLRVLNVLDQLLKLGRRIPRQPRKWRLLPQTGEQIDFGIAMVVPAINRPRGISSHDMWIW